MLGCGCSVLFLLCCILSGDADAGEGWVDEGLIIC